jgi:hypothetical protein
MMDFNERNLRAVGVTTRFLIALRHSRSGRVSVCVMISSYKCRGDILRDSCSMNWNAGHHDAEFERLE